ncbi:MAG: amidohydrolase family protein [Candidatus Tectomicrobia bacterium]|nr:amidohydrolase family protein [Candidatus Tectomicrobia bacterium]
MTVIDGDGHVLESLETFGDAYLDPQYHDRRPQAVTSNGSSHWLIDSQLFPRYSGRSPHVIGTPTGGGGVKSSSDPRVKDTRASNQLHDPAARLARMALEGIDLQVIYPTLFLVWELSADPAFGSALCRAYNNWVADKCRESGGKLFWVAVVNLQDVQGAVAELRRVKAERDPVAVMIMGTAGDRPLNHPSLFPFFAAAEELRLPIAVHVGWCSPSFSNMYDNLIDSLLIPFALPLIMGFEAFVCGGLLDRFPRLRVVFLELGCEWVHFMLHRMEHWTRFCGEKMPRALLAKRPPLEYLRGGQVYFGTEVDDELLPAVVNLVGEDHLIYGSDIPHGDREFLTVQTLRGRNDLSESAKRKMLEENVRRFYNL